MKVDLVPASDFTIEELTAAYNNTRVDYIVPMPMNVAKMNEYIHLYDVNLDQSIVALEGETILGLGMLGIRGNNSISWITRLGLLAASRGKGVGKMLVKAMLENSDALGIKHNVLEVIVGNTPAHNLFKKYDFEDIRKLLILRRAPKEVRAPKTKAYWMERGEIIYHLNRREEPQAWTNMTESLAKAKGVTGFKIEMNNGGTGWLVFQRTLFNLSRIMYKTRNGDPNEIIFELLRHLHTAYPNLDTYTENIPGDAEHLKSFVKMGYIEAFQRIEMYRYPKLD